MNLNSQIMSDNIMYLNEWKKYNESLRDNLQIIGPDLICNIDGKTEAIDISDYYLPDILYNENLREDLPDRNKINAEDLFKIIRVNVLAQTLKSDMSINNNTLYITKMEMRQDSVGKEFLAFEDNYGHQFKVSKNIPKTLEVYQSLLKENEQVSFYEFKKRLEALKNGENL